MLASVRQTLSDYATGMGLEVATVMREFRKLPEEKKFEVLASLRELEKKHQAWVANGGKAPPEPPLIYDAQGQPIQFEEPGEPAEVVPIREDP